jgi:DNA-binding transcriptional ArsR family regulator
MSVAICSALTSLAPRRSARRSTWTPRPAAATRSRALGDATRMTVALALREGGELCVCDLAWITERAENLVGHHLRARRDAGLASSRRDGKIVFYALAETGRRLLNTLLELEAPAR